MKLKKLYPALLSLSFAVIVTACSILPDSNNSETALPGDVIIANTDFSTGSLSSLDLDTFTVSNDIFKGEVDSDLRVRSYNNLIYVLNDTNNNIQLIDPGQGYKVLKQAATGPGSNPHDVAVIGDKAYVTLYGGSKLLIIDPVTLEKKGEIDLSSYNPSGAVIPSMDRLWIDTAGHRLYISLQKLVSWKTSEHSSVLILNTDTDIVEKEIKLQCTVGGSPEYITNPYSKFVFASNAAWDNGDGHDHLFIQCSDNSGSLAGGIVAIDTADMACETELLVSEAYLGSTMSDFDYANGKFYVATTGIASGSNVFIVTPGDTAKSTLFHLDESWSIPFAKVNSAGLLLVGDRTSSNPGIWIFDTAESNQLKNSSIISTGLPPYDIALTE